MALSSFFAMLNRFSRVQHPATLWTVAHQAPLSMGFSRQEYWSGLPFPSPEDLPKPGIEPMSHIPCIGRQVLYHLSHLGRPFHSVVSDSLQPHGLKPTKFLYPWNSPGMNTGVGNHSLLQGSSQPRDQTLVSHIAGRFFTV